MRKHQNYTVVSAAGNHIVLIDNKITITKVIKTKALLFCHRLSEWFNEAEVDELIAASAMFISGIGVYVVIAAIA